MQACTIHIAYMYLPSLPHQEESFLFRMIDSSQEENIFLTFMLEFLFVIHSFLFPRDIFLYIHVWIPHFEVGYSSFEVFTVGRYDYLQMNACKPQLGMSSIEACLTERPTSMHTIDACIKMSLCIYFQMHVCLYACIVAYIHTKCMHVRHSSGSIDLQQRLQLLLIFRNLA